ncbi:winged helix-turn-helix domain-containing protein [Halogeometricum borinquense]|uniref:winged helix-turn-helix domain-containing protein n=1 Tax=Halogeometricum borinquense TaxID=60847 RepID=UPI003442C7EC
MVIWDDRILEILREQGTATPSDIANRTHIHVSRPHVSNRLATLAEHKLVEALGNGVYCLTEIGRLYIEGQFDAQAGEKIEPIQTPEGESDPDDWMIGPE